MQKYEELKTILDNMQKDVDKVNRGNAAAGTRVRKSLQHLKRVAQEMRVEIQEMKKSDDGDS